MKYVFLSLHLMNHFVKRCDLVVKPKLTYYIRSRARDALPRLSSVRPHTHQKQRSGKGPQKNLQLLQLPQGECYNDK